MPSFNEHVKDIMEKEQVKTQPLRLKLKKTLEKAEKIRQEILDIENNTAGEIKGTPTVLFYIKRTSRIGKSKEKTQHGFFIPENFQKVTVYLGGAWDQKICSTALPTDDEINLALKNYRAHNKGI